MDIKQNWQNKLVQGQRYYIPVFIEWELEPVQTGQYAYNTLVQRPTVEKIKDNQYILFLGAYSASDNPKWDYSTQQPIEGGGVAIFDSKLIDSVQLKSTVELIYYNFEKDSTGKPIIDPKTGKEKKIEIKREYPVRDKAVEMLSYQGFYFEKFNTTQDADRIDCNVNIDIFSQPWSFPMASDTWGKWISFTGNEDKGEWYYMGKKMEQDSSFRDLKKLNEKTYIISTRDTYKQEIKNLLGL